MSLEMWDGHYAAPDYIFGTEPNVFLASQRHLLQPGQHALAVADGEGRNGVWLAQQGLNVVSVDFSSLAVEKSKKLASARGVTLDCQVSDVLAWDWPVAAFDVVAAIFIQFVAPAQRTHLFQHIKDALKPGGLLLLQGYTPKQLEYKTGGPANIENLYTETLLREAFADMEIVSLHEHEAFIAEGTKHYGQSALIDMVARKKSG
jgi:cyclopropane fatty-acyl-phospholipid synthase-like methyltransferase